MLYTLENVRDNLRTREGRRVFFLGAADTLTSAARDFLAEQRIPILPAAEAKITRYETGDGGFFEEKPEHMTQLTGNLLVPKTHPRILFRGRLDSLEAALLLAIRELPELARPLTEILGCVRNILRCEVLGEPFMPEKLCGLTEDEQRQRSQFPQKYYGCPHFMPQPTDSPAILRLNRLRTQIRETELAAAAAFGRERPDLLRALNRLSSLAYILMLQCKGDKSP